MAITLNSVKCPECGASLPVEEGRKKLFCSYCGAQVIVTDENEHTFRYIDEAGIVQSDNNKEVRMRELDIEERRGFFHDSLNKTMITIWLVVSLVLIILAIGIMFFAGDGGVDGFLFLFYVCGPIVGGGAFLVFKVIPDRANEKVLRQSGGIRFPKGLEPFSENNYEVVYSQLQNAGFTNISCVNMHDLTLGILTKPGKIEKITVNGNLISSGGKVYLPNSPIIITYHGR